MLPIVDLLLTPADETTEYELQQLPPLPVIVRSQHIALANDRISVETLSDATQEIEQAREILCLARKAARPHCVGLACTSLCAALESADFAAHEPTSYVSMLESVHRAIYAVGGSLPRIALLTPYVAEVHELISAALFRRGVNIHAETHLGYESDPEIAEIPMERIEKAALEIVNPARVDVLVISCSGLRIMSAENGNFISNLEEKLGIPVVASLQAHLWDVLQHVGIHCGLQGKGALFRE